MKGVVINSYSFPVMFTFSFMYLLGLAGLWHKTPLTTIIREYKQAL